MHILVSNTLKPERLHWSSKMSPVLDARQHGGCGLLRYVTLLPTKRWRVKPPIYHAIGINDVMHALHATPVAAALGLPMSNPAAIRRAASAAAAARAPLAAAATCGPPLLGTTWRLC